MEIPSVSGTESRVSFPSETKNTLGDFFTGGIGCIRFLRSFLSSENILDESVGLSLVGDSHGTSA